LQTSAEDNGVLCRAPQSMQDLSFSQTTQHGLADRKGLVAANLRYSRTCDRLTLQLKNGWQRCPTARMRGHKGEAGGAGDTHHSTRKGSQAESGAVPQL
jgi:hypothetical protein